MLSKRLVSFVNHHLGVFPGRQNLAMEELPPLNPQTWFTPDTFHGAMPTRGTPPFGEVALTRRTVPALETLTGKEPEQ